MPTFKYISLAALIIIGGFGLPTMAQVLPSDNFGQAMSWYFKAAEAGAVIGPFSPAEFTTQQ